MQLGLALGNLIDGVSPFHAFTDLHLDGIFECDDRILVVSRLLCGRRLRRRHAGSARLLGRRRRSDGFTRDPIFADLT